MQNKEQFYEFWRYFLADRLTLGLPVQEKLVE